MFPYSFIDKLKKVDKYLPERCHSLGKYESRNMPPNLTISPLYAVMQLHKPSAIKIQLSLLTHKVMEFTATIAKNYIIAMELH
jgi:hypothetical protein